jgi:predicted TIM-barrel fold metal-dependent hydrolase
MGVDWRGGPAIWLTPSLTRRTADIVKRRSKRFFGAYQIDLGTDNQAGTTKATAGRSSSVVMVLGSRRERSIEEGREPE